MANYHLVPAACLITAMLATSTAVAQDSPTVERTRWEANDDDLVTDRPDAAESPLTVGFLRWQLESGVDVAMSDAGTDLSTPTKMRFGVWHFVEVHLETDGVVWSRPEAGSSQTGGADLDVGAKLELPDFGGPQFGVLLALTTPVGASAITGDHWALSPTLAIDQGLGGDFGLAVNVGITTPLTSREAVADTLRWAVALGWAATPITDRLGFYLESFAETDLKDGTRTAFYIDGGATFAVTPAVQLDVLLRGGFASAPDAFGGGGGISIKL